MNSMTKVRIKGTNWESVAVRDLNQHLSNTSSHAQYPSQQSKAGRRRGVRTIILDLAIKHFRRLRPTSTEARRLSRALRDCLNGDAFYSGPVEASGKQHFFLRHANAITIFAGEHRMHLPLEYAKSLLVPLRAAMKTS